MSEYEEEVSKLVQGEEENFRMGSCGRLKCRFRILDSFGTSV